MITPFFNNNVHRIQDTGCIVDVQFSMTQFVPAIFDFAVFCKMMNYCRGKVGAVISGQTVENFMFGIVTKVDDFSSNQLCSFCHNDGDGVYSLIPQQTPNVLTVKWNGSFCLQVVAIFLLHLPYRHINITDAGNLTPKTQTIS